MKGPAVLLAGLLLLRGIADGFQRGPHHPRAAVSGEARIESHHQHQHPKPRGDTKFTEDKPILHDRRSVARPGEPIHFFFSIKSHLGVICIRCRGNSYWGPGDSRRESRIVCRPFLLIRTAPKCIFPASRPGDIYVAL